MFAGLSKAQFSMHPLMNMNICCMKMYKEELLVLFCCLFQNGNYC